MSQSSSPDTIFALSSGRGRAGVAVIRVSGPRSKTALRTLAGVVIEPRQAKRVSLRDPGTQQKLDNALALLFTGPASFTGEDTVELHVHGGPAVIAGVLGALGSMQGLRPADAGEFTRRAFENGKLDLTEAEGLADLIDAETQAQRLQALRQSGGGLRRSADGWRDEIIRAMSFVEAALDFSDEADVPELIETRARPIVEGMLASITQHLESARRGERLRDGLQVVLAGPPNAGKSSLLNALADRDVAIVSREPGTTRDVIEVHLDLGGYPVTLIDTAGLRETTGAVEREGMRRTVMRARDADLVLWLVDATAPQWRLPDDLGSAGVRVVVVLNKIDLEAPADVPAEDVVTISAKTGAGLEALIAGLATDAAHAMGGGEPALVTRERQRRELEACRDALQAFLDGEPLEVELRAEDLRLAAHALGRLSGRVDVEDVLDRVFAGFCIGK